MDSSKSPEKTLYRATGTLHSPAAVQEFNRRLQDSGLSKDALAGALMETALGLEPMPEFRATHEAYFDTVRKFAGRDIPSLELNLMALDRIVFSVPPEDFMTPTSPASQLEGQVMEEIEHLRDDIHELAQSMRTTLATERAQCLEDLGRVAQDLRSQVTSDLQQLKSCIEVMAVAATAERKNDKVEPTSAPGVQLGGLMALVIACLAMVVGGISAVWTYSLVHPQAPLRMDAQSEALSVLSHAVVPPLQAKPHNEQPAAQTLRSPILTENTSEATALMQSRDQAGQAQPVHATPATSIPCHHVQVDPVDIVITPDIMIGR